MNSDYSIINSDYPNVLQIAPTPFFSDRGCHIRIEGIVRCLTELGYDNTVCTYHHGQEADGISTRRITPVEGYTKTSAGPSKHKLKADWRLLWLCVKTYKEIRPVAIHAHLHEGLMIGFLLKSIFFWRRTPLIGDMQGSLVGELEEHGTFEKRGFLRWPVKLAERFLMWAADYIVCSSRHSLDKIQDDFNIDSSKISLAQDGADPVPALTKEREKLIRGKLRLPENRTIAVYSGALHNSKGLDDLKRIIISCKDMSDEVHFLIVGYPKDELSSFLKKIGLRKMCTLTGRVPFRKLPQYLAMADIAIDPKYTDAGEGSGKMLNYMACGLPVIAFNGINNRKFLPEGTPLANSPTELAENFKTLHRDKKLRAVLAAAHLRKFKENYSWRVTKQQLETVYAQAFD